MWLCSSRHSSHLHRSNGSNIGTTDILGTICDRTITTLPPLPLLRLQLQDYFAHDDDLTYILFIHHVITINPLFFTFYIVSNFKFIYFKVIL